MQNNKQFDFSGLMNFLNSSSRKEKQEAAEKMKSRLNDEENRQLNDILNDSSKIEAILKSSAAQQIINRLNGHSDGKLK